MRFKVCVMVRKPTKFPQKGEIIIGRITKVNPFSASVKLLEYPEIEGMVHISEVARKWVKDIREFVKVEKQIVAKVIRIENKLVMLSMKRVSRNEAESKLKEFKREQRAEKMLELAAKELGISLDQAYKEVGFKLQEEFGELWTGFIHAMNEKGRKLLLKRGIPEKWVKVLAEVAERSIGIRETVLKGYLELTCSSPNGIEIIKTALLSAKKAGVEIRYISAPKYLISLRTTEAKKGEKALLKAAETAIKLVQKHGGQGSFKRID